MAFLTGSMNVQVYTDSSQTNFPTQYSLNEQPTWSNNSIVSVQTLTISLAAAGTQTVNTNGLGTTITRMYFFSDTTNVNVNINGLGNILFHSGDPAYIPATITSIVLTNASSSSATTVTLALIGT